MACRGIQFLTLLTHECLLYIAEWTMQMRVLKDLEMGRLSCIIRVDPKCNYKYSCKRETGGDLTERRGRRQCGNGSSSRKGNVMWVHEPMK